MFILLPIRELSYRQISTNEGMKMIKIEIKDPTVETRSGTKNGRDWSMRQQTAYAHTVNRNGTVNAYPEKMIITLNNDQQPYQAGTYTLDPSSLYVGDFNSLRLGTPVLKRLEAKPAAVAA